MDTIKVIIADDHPLFREGIASVLGTQKDFLVAGEATNGQELIKKVDELIPDIILLDLRMPVMGGKESMEHIQAKYPDMKFIVISMNEREADIVELMEHGCHGYLLKNASAEIVVETIRKVMADGDCFTDEQYKMLHKSLTRKDTVVPVFSEKELQIIRGICKELSSEEISHEMRLSPRTVEGYRTRIIQKMNVKNIVGVVKYAMQNNLLD